MLWQYLKQSFASSISHCEFSIMLRFDGMIRIFQDRRHTGDVTAIIEKYSANIGNAPNILGKLCESSTEVETHAQRRSLSSILFPATQTMLLRLRWISLAHLYQSNSQRRFPFQTEKLLFINNRSVRLMQQRIFSNGLFRYFDKRTRTRPKVEKNCQSITKHIKHDKPKVNISGRIFRAREVNSPPEKKSK